MFKKMYENLIVLLSIALIMKKHPKGIEYLYKGLELGGDLVPLTQEEDIILKHILNHQ
mgnify:CR=1 FL=1